MQKPEEIASDVVSGLSFSSNRMLDGRLVGEQYFAHDAIRRAILVDRAAMAQPITLVDVRLHAGQGRLSYDDILEAVNDILRERAKA